MEVSQLEGFGESSFLNIPSFEYAGDLYAGFNHSDNSEKLKEQVQNQFRRQNAIDNRKVTHECNHRGKVVCLFIPDIP